MTHAHTRRHSPALRARLAKIIDNWLIDNKEALRNLSKPKISKEEAEKRRKLVEKINNSF